MKEFPIVPCKHITSPIGFFFFAFGTHNWWLSLSLAQTATPTIYHRWVFYVLRVFLYLDNLPVIIRWIFAHIPNWCSVSPSSTPSFEFRNAPWNCWSFSIYPRQAVTAHTNCRLVGSFFFTVSSSMYLVKSFLLMVCQLNASLAPRIDTDFCLSLLRGAKEDGWRKL